MSLGTNIRLLRRMDWWLTAAIVLLAVVSVVFIYSASYQGPGQPMPKFFKMQMLWFGAGTVLYFTLALVDYRLICQWAAVWYALALGLLVMVLLFGTRVNGAKSWFGWHGYGIQPVEFAKLAVTVMLSYYLFHRPPSVRRQWRTVLGALALALAPAALIMLQPDLGSTLVLIPIGFGLMFVAGARLKHLVVAAVLGTIVGVVGLQGMWKLKEIQARNAGKSWKNYQKARLLVFLDPDHDRRGAGWHLNQSLIAVGSGGLKGKGYLEGTQTLLGYMPRNVSVNDFLFSVIAEEKGFFGGIGVIGLYAVILFSGLRIAANARDRLGMLLATGVVAMLFFHVFINIGMTIGLMPVTGLPLPLLSYGGSFVLASMTALGLLQNIWIHRRIY